MVHMTPSSDIIYEILYSLAYEGKIIKNPDDSTLIFPDKLKNLKGYEYRVPLYYQPPLITNHRIATPLQYFLKAIAFVQNARFKILLMENSSQFITLWGRRQMDLTLNTAIAVKLPSRRLFIYDKKSYCALVPIPQKAALFDLIFIKPFDGLTWMLFGVAIISSVAVWKLFHDRGAVDSHWRLAAGIFKMFIGQGAAFSHRNRFVLAVLLNIICCSVFILSNLYEGHL
ncbi:hypothetical protein ACKWTF_015605 [Chironomus riparius]